MSMNTTDNHDSNHSTTNDPQGDNMNDDSNPQPQPALLIWTKPDGTTETGTFADIGQRYYADGYGQDGHSLTPAASPEATDEPEHFPMEGRDEDTDDEATEVPAPVVEVVTATAITAADVAEVVSRRTAAANRTDWTTAVHEDDREAAEADKAMLIAAGLTPGRTYFAPGTPLVQWGLDKWRTERQSLDDMPRLDVAAQEVAEAVRAERRDDTTVAYPSELRMEVDSGRLVLTRGGGGLQIERHGLQRLAAGFPGMLPGAAFRGTMTADETAYLWNSRASRRLSGSRDTVLRHRDAPDGSGRSLYAVVSSSYGAHDADAIAQDLARMTPGDVSGAVVYDADRAALTWELASMRDVPPVVGEVWKAGLRGGSKDDGTGSAWNSGAFWRAICCNLTTEVLETSRSRQRHRGQHVAEAFRVQLLEAWKAMGPAFDTFRNRWTVLADTAATDILGGDSVADAIANLVDQDKGLRDAVGIKRDALVAMLLQSHSSDPGDSLADVVNAVTRLHEAKLAIPARAAVEAHAGVMVMDFANRVVSA